MTEAEQKDYSEYEGKRVILVEGDPKNTDADTTEREGTLVKATKVGVMFKEKGKANPEVIMADHVLSIVLAPDNSKVTQRWIKEVPVGSVKQHLADRHGFLLSVLNAEGDDTISEEQAKVLHDRQHAESGGDLGHAHGEKPKTRKDEAIEKAEADNQENAGEPQPTLVEDDGDDDGDAF